MVVCTQTSVVTPQTISVSMPRLRRSCSRSVWWKAPLPGLSITGSSAGGGEGGDDVVAGLAADQDAAHRAGVADAPGGRAARELGGGRVGEVGAVALAGVDHQDPRGAGGGERGRAGLDRPAQLADVVAERLAEAAGLEEVALHVDDDQGGAAGIEGDRGWLRPEEDFWSSARLPDWLMVVGTKLKRR